MRLNLLIVLGVSIADVAQGHWSCERDSNNARWHACQLSPIEDSQHAKACSESNTAVSNLCKLPGENLCRAARDAHMRRCGGKEWAWKHGKGKGVLGEAGGNVVDDMMAEIAGNTSHAAPSAYHLVNFASGTLTSGGLVFKSVSGDITGQPVPISILPSGERPATGSHMFRSDYGEADEASKTVRRGDRTSGIYRSSSFKLGQGSVSFEYAGAGGYVAVCRGAKCVRGGETPRKTTALGKGSSVHPNLQLGSVSTLSCVSWTSLLGAGVSLWCATSCILGCQVLLQLFKLGGGKVIVNTMVSAANQSTRPKS